MSETIPTSKWSRDIQDQAIQIATRANRTILLSNIPGPPCAKCEFWRPEARFTSQWGYDGATLCHAKDQFKDFSCFQERTLATSPTTVDGNPSLAGKPVLCSTNPVDTPCPKCHADTPHNCAI